MHGTGWIKAIWKQNKSEPAKDLEWSDEAFY